MTRTMMLILVFTLNDRYVQIGFVLLMVSAALLAIAWYFHRSNPRHIFNSARLGFIGDYKMQLIVAGTFCVAIAEILLASTDAPLQGFPFAILIKIFIHVVALMGFGIFCLMLEFIFGSRTALAPSTKSTTLACLPWAQGVHSMIAWAVVVAMASLLVAYSPLHGILPRCDGAKLRDANRKLTDDFLHRFRVWPIRRMVT